MICMPWEQNRFFFYDNISCARPKFEYIRDMEEGMENGCRQGNVTYAGSEIKELSDIFSYDQYDLVGFIAGIVEKKKENRNSTGESWRCYYWTSIQWTS